jgi:hypothetical protein
MNTKELRSVAYLHHHINTTFKEACEERVVMSIDWHDSHGATQASLNMSEPLAEVKDDVDLGQLGSKLTLLLPPFDENSDEYDYVELFDGEPLDEDFDE